MIKLENYEVVGWEHAIRGMRNPMNSWVMSDSSFKEMAVTTALEDGKCIAQNVYYDALSIGENDHSLMMRLRKGGSDDRKFMRMIVVYVDITAPLYWWKEFDTYKVGTVSNSCSTMHKIHAKEFTDDDFSSEHLCSGYMNSLTVYPNDGGGCDDWCSSDILDLVITALNDCRNQYLKTNDKKYWWQMIQLLPSTYNQRRTIMLNYEVLANMYKARKNHKLDEWREFCSWIETLPYSEIIKGE